MSLLRTNARALVEKEKGILAADESVSTAGKRLATIRVGNTEEHRRAYREMLFTTSGIERYLSGVILFDETIRQSTTAGVSFPTVLLEKGIQVGVKVDEGTAPLEGSEGETVTHGLDGLSDRLVEYRALGATFAKWRGVYTISDTTPSEVSLSVNADALARYARQCQDAEIVPIVEPEVLMDGTHTIERCAEVTTAVLTYVFASLREHDVDLKGVLLKPNMITEGVDASVHADVATVARMTLDCFKRVVPEDVPGIVFLSGGQSEERACAHLSAMNAMEDRGPWELSFSYGRALQREALEAWGGKSEHVSAGQDAFLRRARLTSAARMGVYTGDME